MPTNGSMQTYGFLEQLSTEQLLDLIRADFESSEDGNEDLTIQILEVIERRETEQPTGLLPDVDQAWEDFQRYFRTPDGTGRPLYPMKDSDLNETDEHLRGPRGRGKLLSRLLAAAAVAAVTFSSMIAAQGLGIDVFGALAQWTAETFHFTAEPAAGVSDAKAEALRQAVQGAFDSCGISIPAPSWYPEGTTLARDIEVIVDSENTMVMCKFLCSEELFYVEVQKYSATDCIPSYTLEKDALNVEEYYNDGRLFYIMSNESHAQAVYSSGQIIMTIEGTLSSEIIKQIIDSIGA